MKSKALLFASLFLLNACFLQQHDPTPHSSPGNTAVSGVVALEDLRGAKTEAMFFAAFGRKSEAKQVASHRVYQVAAAVANDVRAAQCELGKKQKTAGAMAAAITPISMGKVSFGPANQPNVVDADESSEHKYTKKLDPGFGAGFFQVKVQGIEGMTSLNDVLSMPEELKLAKGNDQAFEDGVIVERGSPLTLTWQGSSLANEANYLIADVLGETEKELFQLHCVVKESELPAKATWEIPVTEMEKLSLTESAAIYFVRAHVRAPRDPQWEVQLQGIRTYVAAAAIR